MQDRPVYDISKTIGYQVSKIAQLYSQRTDEELLSYGLTGQSWFILIALIEMQITRPSDIAQYLKVKRTSLSRTLSEMEKMGLISRQSDGLDKRARAIVATDKGRDVYRNALPKTLSVSTHFRAKLSSKEFDALRGFIGQDARGRISLT